MALPIVTWGLRLLPPDSLGNGCVPPSSTSELTTWKAAKVRGWSTYPAGIGHQARACDDVCARRREARGWQGTREDGQTVPCPSLGTCHRPDCTRVCKPCPPDPRPVLAGDTGLPLGVPRAFKHTEPSRAQQLPGRGALQAGCEDWGAGLAP